MVVRDVVQNLALGAADGGQLGKSANAHHRDDTDHVIIDANVEL